LLIDNISGLVPKSGHFTSEMEECTPGRGKIARSRFRPHEDALLRLLVWQFGTEAWGEIASRMAGRNVRQCRDRWNHYLAEATISWVPGDELILRQRIAPPRFARERVQNRNPQEVRWPRAHPSAVHPELAAPIPEPVAELPLQESIEDSSRDAMAPVDLGTDVPRTGEEFWIASMRESWAPDFL
jgi:hypothetical protein